MTKNQYREVLEDNFPPEIKLTLGDKTLVYRKEVYKINLENGSTREAGLRYGENPGQAAALYRLVNGNLLIAGVSYVGPELPLVSGLSQMDPKTSMMYGSRKHPSKTNLTDVDSALNVLRYLNDLPASVIVKHNNPSGVAIASSLSGAFSKSLAGDLVAAFGGAAVVNRPVDRETARLMSENYLEVIAAPDYEEGVLDILTKKPDLRVFKIKNIEKLKEYQTARFLDIKSLLDGGLILQESSVNQILTPEDFKPASTTYQGITYTSKRTPDTRELKDLVFGWAVLQAVVSNSVLFVKDGATVSIAGGQQDRVGVVEIAVFKAKRNFTEILSSKEHGLSTKDLEKKISEKPSYAKDLLRYKDEAERAHGGLTGGVLVSDGFFPFRDVLDLALKEGVTAVAHPGGAIRDFESIQAANDKEPPVAMVFTGQRAFKH
ncbi:MAG: IMP cyclohydrolase [Deltaproteobacteria bacterium]|jgi:phosphoribosylaminoimidazolecarboxamide formyltransferase/IMP cyclohydrolase|nr:IMP cyclohydrolase [Deltaproteobacteria bacterium]